MKKQVLLLSACIVALGGTFSCKKSSNNPPANSASLMVVNGCTGTGTIGVSATSGGTAVNNASAMAYLKSSGYQFVTAGTSVNIAFSLAGVGALSNGTMDMTTNAHYSVFAGGSITHPSFVGTGDDLTVVAGMAKVRFVNLSPDNLNEKCYVGTLAVDSNIFANTVGQFHSISPVSGVSLNVYDPSTVPPAPTVLSGVTFSAGKIYTVVLTGTTAGSGAPGLALTVLDNY